MNSSIIIRSLEALTFIQIVCGAFALASDDAQTRHHAIRHFLIAFIGILMVIPIVNLMLGLPVLYY